MIRQKHQVKIFLLNNRIFYSLLIIDIAICTILNYQANVMNGILGYYYDFANFFSYGCDYSKPFINGCYTFPMWGYGFLLAITKNKLLIVVFQQLLTCITIIFIDYYAKKYNWIKSIFIFRSLILLSCTWFFFHTSLYPYSISANLLILSIFMLLIYLENEKVFAILTSGVLFGLGLNLRSDYYYYILILFLILILLRIFKCIRTKPKWLIVWFLLINLTLIPWGIYTYKRTGHYCQTSTNAGHVLFISLGQLPNNIWGITASDEDFLMKGLVKEKFGLKGNSLNFQENRYLIKQWKDNVTKHPIEYAKKCVYNMIKVIITPFYTGNVECYFYSFKELTDVKIELKNSLSTFSFSSIIRIASTKYLYYIFIQVIFNLINLIVFITFITSFIKYLLVIRFRLFNNYLSLVLLSIILYQLGLCIFAYYLPIYLSNVYLIFVFLVVYFYDTILILRKRINST